MSCPNCGSAGNTGPHCTSPTCTWWRCSCGAYGDAKKWQMGVRQR